MIFELRQYRMLPGQEQAWVTFMEEEIIPFQVSMGMEILGSWVGTDDPGQYVWLRRFESEEEMARLFDAVYKSDHWRNEIGPKVFSMIDRDAMVQTKMLATPRSLMQ